MNLYDSEYAAQIGVLGADGQARLGDATVMYVGCGRAGSTVALTLGASGVLRSILLDPQTFGPDNFNSMVPATRADVGVPKAKLVRRALLVRPGAAATAVVDCAESPAVKPFYAEATLIVSAANTVPARQAAARAAFRLKKPIVDVAVADCREMLAGSVRVWLPENESWSACPGCFFDYQSDRQPDEGILSAVVSMTASIAVNIVVQLLSGVRDSVVRSHNFCIIDAENYTLEFMAVRRRSGCSVCG